MKIFLEGNQNHNHRVGVLVPGVNEVPDDVARALVNGCVAYCESVKKANPNAQPVQLFRFMTEADEPKPEVASIAAPSARSRRSSRTEE